MNARIEKPGRCTRCGRSYKRIRKGLCIPCYERDLRLAKMGGNHGTPQVNLKEWILERVHVNEAGCWIWPKPINPGNGYGQFGINGLSGFAHRLAYEVFIGPIPDGLEVDHVCHSNDATCQGGRACPHRPCCNPDHLEATTPAENNRRSKSVAAVNAAKTHCSRGHEFNAENTITVWRSTPPGMRQRRKCRSCEAIWKKAARKRKHSLPQPPPKNPRSPRKSPPLATHCPNGHEYTPENTHFRKRPDGTTRSCRKCACEASRRYRERQTQAVQSGETAARRAALESLNGGDS